MFDLLYSQVNKTFYEILLKTNYLAIHMTSKKIPQKLLKKLKVSVVYEIIIF